MRIFDFIEGIEKLEHRQFRDSKIEFIFVHQPQFERRPAYVLSRVCIVEIGIMLSGDVM